MISAETIQKYIEFAQAERLKNVGYLMEITQRKKNIEAAINQIDGALQGYKNILDILKAAENSESIKEKD